MTLRVLIAPDKFKGTLLAPDAAAALATGWRSARPADELTVLPMADGGDGTVAVLAQDWPAAEWVAVPTVDAVGMPRLGRYLRSGDTAAVELAETCGIAGLSPLDPMGSHTIGLGIVLAAAVRAGVRRLVVALGGSASTDGGTGALSALGAQWVGAGGLLPVGGRGLTRLAAVRTDRLLAVPPEGVRVLVDVQAPLYGPSGAAYVFGPQKGATDAEVEELDRGLRRLAAVLGSDPDLPGCGAAGGAGYGLAYWGAELTPGAAAIAELIGLPDAVRQADLVITGEGRFDAGSLTGKACGYVLQAAADRGVPALVVAGSVAGGMAAAAPGASVLSLAELAGSVRAAQDDPVRWLGMAGRQAAATVGMP